MRLLKIDRKHKTISVIPENEDDVWHLGRIIEKGDTLKGLASRKEKGEDGRDTIRKKFLAEIKIESISYDSFGQTLRVNGSILAGSTELPFGSMQVIEVVPGQKFSLIKKELLNYHIERLKRAAGKKAKEMLLVVLDDEKATFAFFRDFRYKIKAEINSKKSGKAFKEGDWKKEFLGNICKKIIDSKPEITVIAGPGFLKDELAELLKEKNYAGKVFVQGISMTGVTGINELVKGPIFAKIAENAQLAKEAQLIETLLGEIAKNSLAEYGPENVKKAVISGAVKELFVLDSLLSENRDMIMPLIETAEKNQANIHIFNSEHDPGKQLEALGGLAALLRFKPV